MWPDGKSAIRPVGETVRDARDDDEYERKRRRGTILGGMLSPGELTLDPEIAREPELAGLVPPRPDADARLGGMSDDEDRLKRMVKALSRARGGYRWNPDSEEGAKQIAAENQLLAKQVWGDTDLKRADRDPNVVGSTAWGRVQASDARTQSRSQKAEQFKDLMKDKDRLYELRKTATGDQTRRIDSMIAQDDARIGLLGTKTEIAELERDYYPEKMEAEMGLTRARTKEIEERVQTILPKAEALLQKWADDERHKEDAAALRAWLAQLTAANLDERTKGEILDNIEKLAKATGIATEERGFFGRVASGSAKEAAKRGVAGAGLAGLSAADVPRTPPARIPSKKVAPLRSSGAQALPTEKPGRDISPSAKPVGDTTVAQTPGVAPAGSAREGGVSAAGRVDLERRTQAGIGKKRRTSDEIRAELAKLRAQS